MADYERQAAKEWSTVNDPATETIRRKTRLIPKLPFDDDNAAKSAWRNNEPPQETFSMPANFVPRESSDAPQSRGRQRNRIDSPGHASPEIAEIAIETSTEIQVGPVRGRDRDAILSIWGTPADASLARSKLEQWVSTYVQRKDSKVEKWAKPQVVPDGQRQKYEAKIKAEIEKAKYRRAPPVDVVFPAIGIFEWRANYDSPEEVLGRNLEACDAIRTKLACYITLDSMQKTLKVAGDKPENVKQAIKRLRGTFFQAVARDRASQSQPKFLITKSQAIDPEAEVEMTPFLSSHEQGSKSTLQDRDGKNVEGARPCLVDHVLDDSHTFSREKDVAAVKKVIERALPTLQNFQGNLEMRARLGTFVLKKYRKGMHSFEDFQNMLEDEEVDGGIYTETDVSGDDMLFRLEHHREMMLPGSGSYERPDVLNIGPTFAATFLVNLNEKSLFKLDVKFIRNENRNIERVSNIWSRMPSADPTVTLKVLDVCLIDLKSNSSAWGVEIKSTDTVNEARNPALASFAESVKLNLDIADDETTDKSFIDYIPQRGMRVEALAQKTTYTVEYQHSHYKLDLSKVRQFRLRNPNGPFANQRSLTPHTPSWKVEVYRIEWDVVFAENAMLGPGEGTKAKVEVSKLFPEKNGGIAGFVDILDRFGACIRGEG